MSNTEVGQLLTGNEGRDAIHIAIAPVVAGEGLVPGDRVTFRDDGDTTIVVKCDPALAVGIADPFLSKAIRPGDRFFMFLNPNTITSLRHEWTHPAFHISTTVDGIPLIEAEAKKRMDDWASGYGFTGRDAVQAGKDYIKNGTYWCDGGTFEGESLYNQYWEDFQILTGIKVEEHEREHFLTCSC